LNSPNPPSPERRNDLSVPDKTLLEQMNSEYRILQDKIDKIGGFRFTIRGWSVTLVIASIIAAGSSKGVPPYMLGLLFLFIYALYSIEKKQNQHGLAFGDRALHLERRIREELRNHSQRDPIVGFYPGIAHHLHRARRRQPPGALRAWVTDPDRFFYIAQFVAVAAAITLLTLLGSSSKPQPLDGQTIIQVEAASPPRSHAEVVNAVTPAPQPSKTQEQSAKEKRH
jgi:hypothetical protein